MEEGRQSCKDAAAEADAVLEFLSNIITRDLSFSHHESLRVVYTHSGLLWGFSGLKNDFLSAFPFACVQVPNRNVSKEGLGPSFRLALISDWFP